MFGRLHVGLYISHLILINIIYNVIIISDKLGLQPDFSLKGQLNIANIINIINIIRHCFSSSSLSDKLSSYDKDPKNKQKKE